MAKRRGSDDWGLLPAIGAGTLFVFYIVWAAMHDIAHEEPGTTPEWIALVLSVPAFAFLYWLALRSLTRTERIVWLSGTVLLVGLFGAAAINAMLHPKYAMDQSLAVLFLSLGTPALGLTGHRLVTDLLGRGSDRRA